MDNPFPMKTKEREERRVQNKKRKRQVLSLPLALSLSIHVEASVLFLEEDWKTGGGVDNGERSSFFQASLTTNEGGTVELIILLGKKTF